MYFLHTTAIWQEFPQLVPGVLVVGGITPAPDVTTRLEPWYERARQRLKAMNESDMPEVAAWRRAYAQMGLKPTQYRSAAEALLRRFRRENTLPPLHPLVDLCNALSLASALPIAVIDIAHVTGFIEVRHADGSERYLAWSGEVEHPEPGEIIFADAAQEVHARRWTFRQSRRSVVQPNTQQALIISEGLHASASHDVPALLDALTAEISAVWELPRQRAVLSADKPRIDFDMT
jgi:DNA/RNA-binding domain of Phe-tRNA-synthetase-like protein